MNKIKIFFKTYFEFNAGNREIERWNCKSKDIGNKNWTNAHANLTEFHFSGQNKTLVVIQN